MAIKKENTAGTTDKQKALETAMAQIEKAYGKGSIMRLGENQGIAVEAVPTGLPGSGHCPGHRWRPTRSHYRDLRP